MAEQLEQTLPLPGEVASQHVTPVETPVDAATNGHVPTEPEATAPAEPQHNGALNGAGPENRHVQAGRKGARRVHELIREGRLYEQERGLKRGRQRLRQLIELGKLYEQEHGLRPARPRKRGRLSRLGREELLTTLLGCLVRIARPSFRAELRRLAEALAKEEPGAARMEWWTGE
jgi:hypothetical protein